jgi:mxaJ protein
MVAARIDDQRLYDHDQGCGLRPTHAARAVIVAALALACTGRARAADPPAAPVAPLVVCADPNNMPFTNQARAGFENKIIERIARDLGTRVQYFWWTQRRGYVRNTLNERKCDVWTGIAAGVQSAATSHPYYRSTYVFVSRRNEHLDGLTLADPRLRTLSIGVQLIGNDATNTPPAQAIASDGITANVHGFPLYANYDRANPQAAIIRAVESGRIDVALVWGPPAGFFARSSKIPLRLDPVTPSDDPRWPMVYDVAVAVRRGNEALLNRINAAIDRDRSALDAILERYDVPKPAVRARS